MKDWRIHFVILLILFLGAAIVGRMFYLQITKGGYYAALAKGQQVDYVDAEPPRGNIFFQDKFNENKVFLAATNKEWPLLYVVPNEVINPRAVASQLVPFLISGTSSSSGSESSSSSNSKFSNREEDLFNRFNDREDPYEFVARKLTEEKVEEIMSLELEGVYTKGEKLRHYSAGPLSSHVLGFVGYRGNERVGQYGIEGYYDDLLRGKTEVSEVSFLPRFGGFNASAPRGKDLVLSIDYNIQFMLEDKLRAVKERLAAESASAVVVDPKTGEILALGMTESFDPGNYSQVETIDIYLNDITQKIFEPGSIFKPFTAAVALNEGKILPNTTYVDKGLIRVGGYTIRNSNNKIYGIQTMTNVLELSLNTGAVYMEESVGHKKFRDYMQRFGFGEITEIDLQGEVRGDIRNILTTSRDINFATASFGQGIAVTSIQLVKAFSALANGGKMVKPHIVKEIIDVNGKRTSVETEIVGTPISSRTAAQITAMLASVVENGYGKKAGVKGYKVAGKTGTAQVPKENGRGYSEKTIHSFIGFAPAYDPRFVALVKVDDPQGIIFSADSVAPLFSEIAEYILNYYEIPPDS